MQIEQDEQLMDKIATDICISPTLLETLTTDSNPTALQSAKTAAPMDIETPKDSPPSQKQRPTLPPPQPPSESSEPPSLMSESTETSSVSTQSRNVSNTTFSNEKFGNRKVFFEF